MTLFIRSKSVIVDTERSNMKQRVITGFFIAVAYVGTILGTIYWSPIVFDVFSLFLMFAAGFEVCRCLYEKLGKTVNFLLVLFIIAEYIVYKVVAAFVGLNQAMLAVCVLTLLNAVIALNYTMFSKKYEVKGGAATCFVLVYPVLPLFVMMSLTYLPGQMFAGMIILAFISTSFADMMAYFVGSLLKGPKFCPEISPKKTISGAIGGLIGGIIAGAIVCVLGRFNIVKIVPLSEILWLDALNWCLIGLGSAIFCEMGDLTSSYIKRVCGIKDFGNVLAGHGGFMDRIDGLIISSSFIFVYASVVAAIL